MDLFVLPSEWTLATYMMNPRTILCPRFWFVFFLPVYISPDWLAIAWPSNLHTHDALQYWTAAASVKCVRSVVSGCSSLFLVIIFPFI
jgi:hypothetical protein